MLARNEESIDYKSLPEKWQKEAQALITDAFVEECEEHHKKIELFNFLYPTELLVIASVLDKTSAAAIPYSCFLSVELTEKTKVEKIQKELTDCLGLILEELFSSLRNEDALLEEVSDLWTDFETAGSGNKFYYKINRENIQLTLEADRLLSQN